MTNDTNANRGAVIATDVIFIVIFIIMCLAWVFMWAIPTIQSKLDSQRAYKQVLSDEKSDVEGALTVGGYEIRNSISVNCSIHWILLVGVIGLIMTSINLGNFNKLYSKLNP